jgi:membrane carboxypeptidase/penicillin-binding protein PbpC
MNRNLVSGVTGAAPIWHDIMKEVLKTKKPVWPEKPDDVVGLSICTTTGLLPDPAMPCQTRFEYFWKGTEPTTPDNGLARDIWIVPSTSLPPKDTDPKEGLLTEKHILLSDPFTKDFCLDCRRPVDEKGHTTYIDSYTIPIFQSKLTP